MDLCRSYNITKSAALDMKMSDVIIHQLTQEKADYLQWYSYNQDRD